MKGPAFLPAHGKYTKIQTRKFRSARFCEREHRERMVSLACDDLRDWIKAQIQSRTCADSTFACILLLNLAVGVEDSVHPTQVFRIDMGAALGDVHGRSAGDCDCFAAHFAVS